MNKLRVYFEHSVVSPITRRNIPQTELSALDKLVKYHQLGHIVIGVSRQSLREIGRAPQSYQSQLKSGMSGLEIASDDHIVLGMQTQYDQYGGFITTPLVTDIVNEQLFKQLCSKGLKEDDAKHLMYAAHNGYSRFIVFDRHFLFRRRILEQLCPTIQIQKPSEFITELYF